MPQKLDSDAELMRRHLGGDESAFEALAGRHAPMVYRTSLRLLGDAHEAEDATQAVFVILTRKAARFRKGGDLAAWLHGIARRVASQARRSKQRRRRREEEGAMLKVASSGEGLSDQEKTAALEALDRELGALPLNQRQAVILRYLEGHGLDEAAAIANCPTRTLSWRASEGLNRLRARLGGRGAMLGTTGLVALLAAESASALPASLVPSVIAASKSAVAIGAAAGTGVAGAKAILLAEGTMKTMLLFKIKVAAAIIGATLVAGASVPVGRNLIAAGEKGPPVRRKPAPVVKAKDQRIRCRVAQVLSAGQVILSGGKKQDVRVGFEFDVTREGKRIGAVKVLGFDKSGRALCDPIVPAPGKVGKNIGSDVRCPKCSTMGFPGATGKCSTCGRSTSSGAFKHCAACARHMGVCQFCRKRFAKPAGVPEIRVGDLAQTRLAEVVPAKDPANGSALTAWGQAVNGLQARLVPLSGGEKWVWNQKVGKYCCPSKKCRMWLRAKKAGVCSECGNIRAGARKFCPSCAARKRVCEVCGKPAPAPNATFTEGEPMRFELQFRNLSDNELRLWGGLRWPDRWRMVFIPKAGGVPRGLRYRGPMPKRAQPADIKLPKGGHTAILMMLGRAFQFDHYSTGPRDATAAPLAQLPVGKYAAQTVFEWKSDKQWKGKVLTAPVEIEVKAGDTSKAETAEAFGLRFWRTLAAADTKAMKKFYAQRVTMLPGCELLKKEWGINPGGNRGISLEIDRDKLLDAYDRMIGRLGSGKWIKALGNIGKDKITFTAIVREDQVLKGLRKGDVLLRVKTGPGDDTLGFVLRRAADKKWAVAMEATDY